jgi:ActR/RegA family two-component response regulator
VLEAVKSGAKDFLVKPCEGDRILAAVSKLCA